MSNPTNNMYTRDSQFIESIVNNQQFSNVGQVNNTQHFHQSISSADPPKLFGFPRLSETIVGRDTDVRLLFDLFKNHHQVLITGIGGLGKTTLASLCATTWVESNQFNYAVLVNAETDNSAETVLRNLAKKILSNLDFTDETITEIYEHYNKSQKKTMFVLDNIEEKCNFHKYLPDKKFTNIFVMGTSQFTEFRRIFKLYELKKLTIDSSVDMIRKVLFNNEIKISTHNIQKTNKLIVNVAEILDCHPLALEHATAYIVDSVLYSSMSVLTSVEQYIKTFNEQLEQEPPFEHPTTYRTPVYTALEMNIVKATSKSEHGSKLLFCMSYLDPTFIDISMFYNHPDFDRERIKMPIRELKKYSIISVNGKIISMHRLIQIVCRNLIKNKNTENHYLIILLNILFYHDDSHMWYLPIKHHFSYFIQNLNVDKETISALYIRAFHGNNKIINQLTARLKLINCNMNDINDWSALHCSVFAGHQTFFEYFDMSESGSNNDRMEHYVSDSWTVFHVQIIKNSKIDLFDSKHGFRMISLINRLSLISFLEFNENQKNKQLVKGFTTLNLCAAFNVDTDDFNKIINIGCDVNIPDDTGMTPILWAAKNIVYDLAFTLHRAGATYDQSYKELLSAASDGDHKSVLALLRTNDIDCVASDFLKMLLWWAVNRTYCDLALELINRRVDITGVDTEGNTVLLAAIRWGNNKVAIELLRLGACINVSNNNGDTPLLWAAWRGYSEVIAELLCHVTNIDVSNNDGNTPLLWAAGRGHSEIVIELLHRGASIDVTNSNGDTPLLTAAKGGYSKVATELLRRGANIDVINNYGDTPLLAATSAGLSEVVIELLRQGANIDISNKYGDTPLLLAAIAELCEVVVELLRRGANINTSNSYGNTPLLLAIGEGRSECAIELLHHGANINVSNNDGNTPLLLATSMGLNKVTAELVRQGAIIDVSNNDGDTPLLLAAREGLSEVAAELLHRHVNINISNNNGDTPLLLAASVGLEEIAIEFLRRGAIVDVRNNDGDTPLLAAANAGHSNVAIELLRHGANTDVSNNNGITPLLAAATWGHIEVFAELLRCGANINVTNNFGVTPLLAAVIWGHSEVAIELMRRGAHIDISSNDGDTPLLLAARGGFSEVVNELLGRGTSTEVRNNNGDTPLLLAARMGHIEVVNQLLCSGASINVKNNGGKTALSYALLKEDRSLEKLLIQHGAIIGGELN